MARALWRHHALTERFVTFAAPSAVGLSSLAGMLEPLPRGSGRGLHVRLARHPAEAEILVLVALALGLVTHRRRRWFRAPDAGGAHFPLSADGTVVALDGEREIGRHGDDGATVRLVHGPRRINVDAVMEHAGPDRRSGARGRGGSASHPG